jgi:hypothetical protein
MPCIRKIVRRRSCGRPNAVIALLQLAAAQGGPACQWLNNCLGGLGRRPVKTLLKNVMWGPDPVKLWDRLQSRRGLPVSSSRADCRRSFIPSQY